MQDLTVAVAVIAFTFLLAGLVKGVVGMGLPTVAMGLLGLVMPPVQAAGKKKGISPIIDAVA